MTLGLVYFVAGPVEVAELIVVQQVAEPVVPAELLDNKPVWQVGLQRLVSLLTEHSDPIMSPKQVRLQPR